MQPSRSDHRQTTPMRSPSTRIRRSLELIGASRHSALPALRARVDTVARPLVVRIVSLLVGSTCIGAAVALLVEADLGLPPYDVLSSGLQGRLGISLGQAGWLVAAVLFAVATLLGRRPSPWGIAYILANGVAVDAMANLLNGPDGLAGRLAFVAAGIVVMALGVSLVLYSGTTGGPFELLMTAGEDRGIPPLRVRYALDVGVLVTGLALGGSFGSGTLLFAAFMGLTLQAMAQFFADYDRGRTVRLAEASAGDADRGKPPQGRGG